MMIPVIMLLTVLVAIGLGAATERPSSLEEASAELSGTWVLESSEIGGEVYKPPKVSGLMVFAERGWAIHTVNPAIAAGEVGTSKVVGSKIVGSIDSRVWINLPPGEGPQVSTEPMPYEAEVSIDGGKISFEPLPGQPWVIEGDKITIGTPGAFLDTWKRVKPSEPAETEIDKLLQGTFVVESQVLPDGTIRKPPEIKGLLVNTGRHYLYHVVSETDSWGLCQIGEVEVKGQDMSITQESQISINTPAGTGKNLERKKYSSKLSVEDGKVSYTVSELGMAWTVKEDTSTAEIIGAFTLNWKRVENP